MLKTTLTKRQLKKVVATETFTRAVGNKIFLCLLLYSNEGYAQQLYLQHKKIKDNGIDSSDYQLIFQPSRDLAMAYSNEKHAQQTLNAMFIEGVK